MEVSQLDFVARAETTKASLIRARIPLTLVSLFFVLLGIVSGASMNETIAVRVLAIIAVVATIMLWLRSRYSPYPLALLFIATLAGGWLFDDPDYHTVLGSTTRAAISVMVLYVGYRWWTNAMPFLAAHSERLKMERSQLQEWLRELQFPGKTDRVIEFSIKSFWRGYWTCRILNTGTCWVVSRFRIRNTPLLLDCRVYELDSVRAADLPGGKLRVEMGDRSSQDVEISPDMRDRLLHFVSAKS
jgi:hypothetical protein